jgi:hypothetical protein
MSHSHPAISSLSGKIIIYELSCKYIYHGVKMPLVAWSHQRRILAEASKKEKDYPAEHLKLKNPFPAKRG